VMEIVRVDWHDARSVDGWCTFGEFNEELTLIHTVGYLIKENEESVYISACVSLSNSGDQYCCTIVIPKRMIVYRQTLDITENTNIKYKWSN
jgi:hypothetical protein